MALSTAVLQGRTAKRRLRVDPGQKGCGLCARDANPTTYLIKDPPRSDYGVDRLAQAVDLRKRAAA